MKPKNYARIAAASVSIGLAAAALTGCVGQPSTPQDIAKAYLEAVQAGDATRAIALVSPGVSKGQRILLTDAALKKAGKIENIAVLDTPSGSNTAGSNHVAVNATYDVDGKTARIQFIADRTSDGWHVTGGYASLRIPISAAAPAFSVNGLVVKQANVSNGQIIVFSGTYRVDLVANQLLAMKSVNQSTADRPSNPVFEVAQAVQNGFDSTLKAFLDGCFAAAAAVRDHACPNWYSASPDYFNSFRWTLIEAPTYRVSYADGKFEVIPVTRIRQRLSYLWNVTGVTVMPDLAGGDISFEANLDNGAISFVPSCDAWSNPYGVTAAGDALV
jgi:hypothetical protein